MLTDTVEHLMQYVLPAAIDYERAEQTLSAAFDTNPIPGTWGAEAADAKRKASQLAIAIDGLTDRAFHDLKLDKNRIRTDVSALCYWPGSTALRCGSFDRVREVANAYKHKILNDPALPITSDADVLVVELGFGLDGVGVGKFDGVEVLVRDKTGTSWKFLGDAPTVVGAWFRFLSINGGHLPSGPVEVCGLQVYP